MIGNYNETGTLFEHQHLLLTHLQYLASIADRYKWQGYYSGLRGFTEEGCVCGSGFNHLHHHTR